MTPDDLVFRTVKGTPLSDKTCTNGSSPGVRSASQFANLPSRLLWNLGGDYRF